MLVGMELRDMIQHTLQIELQDSMIFNSAICGYYQDKLVTILPSNKKLLPYTILVDANEFDRLKEQVYDNKIRLSTDRKINYQKIQLQADGLQTDSNKLEQNLKQFLVLFGNQSNNLLAELEGENEWSNKVHQLLKALKNKDLVNTENIIGKGIGLTPASDDFLLGMYSYLIVKNDLQRKKLLEQYIYMNMDKTTLVSRWAFKYAIDSQVFSETVLAFYCSGDFSKLFPLLQHGSTSGLDMITGIYFGMKVFG